MDDLVTFLRARFDDSEQVAKAALAGWRTMPFGRSSGTGINAEALLHAALHSPARVLREVEAKRRILDVVLPEVESMELRIDGEWGVGRGPIDDASGPLLRLLALPYADHPDYREEWKL